MNKRLLQYEIQLLTGAVWVPILTRNLYLFTHSAMHMCYVPLTNVNSLQNPIVIFCAFHYYAALLIL